MAEDKEDRKAARRAANIAYNKANPPAPGWKSKDDKAAEKAAKAAPAPKAAPVVKPAKVKKPERPAKGAPVSPVTTKPFEQKGRGDGGAERVRRAADSALGKAPAKPKSSSLGYRMGHALGDMMKPRTGPLKRSPQKNIRGGVTK